MGVPAVTPKPSLELDWVLYLGEKRTDRLGLQPVASVDVLVSFFHPHPPLSSKLMVREHLQWINHFKLGPLLGGWEAFFFFFGGVGEVVETGSPGVAQAGLEFALYPRLALNLWAFSLSLQSARIYRYVPPHLCWEAFLLIHSLKPHHSCLHPSALGSRTHHMYLSSYFSW